MEYYQMITIFLIITLCFLCIILKRMHEVASGWHDKFFEQTSKIAKQEADYIIMSDKAVLLERKVLRSDKQIALLESELECHRLKYDALVESVNNSRNQAE